MSGYVYVLFDKPDNNLSIGVTSNLLLLMFETKNNRETEINKLAYYEKYGDITEAIVREKELQELSKADLVSLIQSDNEHWQDLHDAILKIWNDSAKLHEENQIRRHKGENI